MGANGSFYHFNGVAWLDKYLGRVDQRRGPQRYVSRFRCRSITRGLPQRNQYCSLKRSRKRRLRRCKSLSDVRRTVVA
jgi:hypothetical protein